MSGWIKTLGVFDFHVKFVLLFWSVSDATYIINMCLMYHSVSIVSYA